MKISILGAGSWGTALGQVLQDNGLKVMIWHYNDSFVSEINSTYRHPSLPSVLLSNKIQFTSSIKNIIEYGELLIVALPTQSIRKVLLEFPSNYNKPVISVSKGIEINSGYRVGQIVLETLNTPLEDYIVLSGPTHAEEVANRYPSAIVAASINSKNAKMVQKLFSNNNFRVYTSKDVIGVEIGGSSKNVIAIASGICSGLGLGDNTIAALVTRGLEEIVRFGISLGANRSTFSGLSGIGDLVVTAYSMHSRNRQVGIRLGKDEKLDEIVSTMDMVAEGVETCKSIYDLSHKNNIDMPICNQVFKVLFLDTSPREAILELMGRELVDEYSN